MMQSDKKITRENGKKDILDLQIKKAVREFLMQGLLITNIQEAVGGSLS